MCPRQMDHLNLKAWELEQTTLVSEQLAARMDESGRADKKRRN